MMKYVVVDSPAVVDETERRGKAVDDDALYSVSRDEGDVVPIPTFPPAVARYAAPVDVRAVVDAYGNVEANVEVAVKYEALT